MSTPMIVTRNTDPKIAEALIRAARHWKGPDGIHSKRTDYRVLDLEERVGMGMDFGAHMEVIEVTNANAMGEMTLHVIVNRELCDSPMGLRQFICKMLATESSRLIQERREQRKLVC